MYFACSPSKQHFELIKEENVQSILVSYHYLKKPQELLRLLNGYEPERIMLDSGAFSVWSNGGKIDIEEYVKFCLELRDILSPKIKLNIVNLDVLPGVWGFVPSKEDIDRSAEQGWKNMEYMEYMGLKVIHTFHQHEDFRILEKLCNHSDYIGISPANDVSNKEKLAWMNKVFSFLQEKIKNGLKTHGFAVTSHRQLYNYPYYSADSSSWVTPARYGRIPIMTDKFEIKTFSYKDVNEIERYWDYLKQVGIDVIADAKSWKGRTRIGIATYRKLGEIATRIWTERGVVYAENS